MQSWGWKINRKTFIFLTVEHKVCMAFSKGFNVFLETKNMLVFWSFHDFGVGRHFEKCRETALWQDCANRYITVFWERVFRGFATLQALFISLKSTSIAHLTGTGFIRDFVAIVVVWKSLQFHSFFIKFGGFCKKPIMFDFHLSWWNKILLFCRMNCKNDLFYSTL